MENALFMSRVGERETPAVEISEIAGLVTRTIAGDRTAFELIVARYERRVLTLSLRLLGEPEDAQDAAQDVFLRAYKYIHRLDTTKPIEPWLVRMTVNVCRDIGRLRQRRRAAFPTVATEVIAVDTSADPHHGMAVEQQRQLLRKALDELGEKERMAVVLRDIEGFSTAEVAAILRSSETTVRSQVSRARVKIKETIELLIGGRR
jgi:RNA polymerase sigma-70 factor, ECF subfamily